MEHSTISVSREFKDKLDNIFFDMKKKKLIFDREELLEIALNKLKEK